MVKISDASKLYVGSSLASKAYVGTNLVWPASDAFTTWKAAVVAAGGSVSGTPTTGREKVIRDLISGLQTDGIWAKLDRLWLLAAENTQSALIDLVARDQATAVSTPAFTTDRGYAGNGSSSYIDTTFNASTQGAQYVLNNAHMGVWDNTSRGDATTAQTGAYDGSGLCDLLTYTSVFGPLGLTFRLNGGGATLTSSPSSGFFIAQRATATALEGFRNGTSVGTAAASASISVPNCSFFICSRSDNGTSVIPSTDQIAAVSYGASFTSTQAANYYTRMRTYMTAVGVP